MADHREERDAEQTDAMPAPEVTRAEAPPRAGDRGAPAERGRSTRLADQVADYDVQLRIADSLERIADTLDAIGRNLAEAAQRERQGSPGQGQRYRGGYPPRRGRDDRFGGDQQRRGRDDQGGQGQGGQGQGGQGFAGGDRRGGGPPQPPSDRYRQPRRRWDRS